MNPINFALRRPKTIVVLLIAIISMGLAMIRPKSFDDWLRSKGVDVAIPRMPVDIFPALNLPVIYVCQPYGGMDAAQMEGLLTNYYEYHFLYINGIHHVESRNVQGTALMKLVFHPGTNMAQAMAETINYVNRSRAMMPPGTVPPFVMRFDTGSVPVGYLVLSSGTKTIAEIQDKALFKVRPMFSSLPGVSAPPPFGGSARSIVIRADPNRLRAFQISPDEVIEALTKGNTISPSGNVQVGDFYPAVPTNALVRDLKDLGSIPVKVDRETVYLRDLGTIEDAADLTTGYALVNGRRAVYILATKRADASTMNVIDEIKRAIPAMQRELPDDIQVGFEFDQSPTIQRAISSLSMESCLGALLTGLMVLLFLRDWRSALIVVINIPIALLFSLLALALLGQTINLMTLGGLALAVGILVDESTVEIENIHSQLAKSSNVALAVLKGNQQTAIPRFLAMLCMIAVFVPTVFMKGAAKELFYPLSMAVAFAMIGSYILSSTLVPVLCVWWLRPKGTSQLSATDVSGVNNGRVVSLLIKSRYLLVPTYLSLCGMGLFWSVPRVGYDLFPQLDAREFRVRMRNSDGTHIQATETMAIAVLDRIKKTVGEDNIAFTLGYVGTVPASFPINSVYQFSRGPEEAFLRVALAPGATLRVDALKETLRADLSKDFPNVRLSFEPSDIVSEVMSFGASSPIEVALRGGTMAELRDFAKKVQQAWSVDPILRDVQVVQSLDYPTLDVRIDREKSGLAGATMEEVSRSVLAATSSSRFVVPSYWPDPKTGIGYQVQVEIPQPQMRSIQDLAMIPVWQNRDHAVLLRDVASISESVMPGEFDRYNMKRELSITANFVGADLGEVSERVAKSMAVVKKADDAQKDKIDQEIVSKGGTKAGRITYELRGQIPPLQQMMSGLGLGLILAILFIFFLLTAHFQSFRLAIVSVAAVPAVLLGSIGTLMATATTLNIQSFIGMIMSLGVAMANAILLISFAEQRRLGGQSAIDAASCAAIERRRPILMTTLAMLAGMLPMAVGWGDTGAQTAPLGRAVIGGLVAATFTTLFILPAMFAWFQSHAGRRNRSLHPMDGGSSSLASLEDSGT